MRRAFFIFALLLLLPLKGFAEDIAEEVDRAVHNLDPLDNVNLAVVAPNSTLNTSNCNPHRTPEQCAADFSVSIARKEAALSKAMARSLAGLAADDEKVANEQGNLNKELAKLDQDLVRLNNDRARAAANDPTAGLDDKNKNGGGKGGGASAGGNKGGGGGGGGGSPAQLASLNSKNVDPDRPGETNITSRPQETPFADGAGGYQVARSNFDPNLGNNQVFQPSLSGNPNARGNTSADVNRNMPTAQQLLGKSSPLQEISGKGQAGREPEAGKGGGGAAPGMGGGGAKGAESGGGPPPVGEQELEPAPPPPKKVAIDYAAAGSGGDTGSGDKDEGDGKDDAVKQVAPARAATQLALGNTATNARDKRTGHGIMDYVGYINDSCHDKTEEKLTALCGRSKEPATPVSGSASLATDNARTLASTNAIDALALAPVTASAADISAAPKAAAPAATLATKVESGIVRNGLERAFSRRLPDDQAL